MKIKKPTKKILIIVVIVAFALGATALYYFLFVQKGLEEKWYDSNWSYRRSIYINDIPREFQGTKQDILVEIDTKTLISEEKLVNDCRDIRFIDEDNNTALKYWIEGGCNTNETQIWVNLQLPRSSEKTIYMYYGNKLATDNQESWKGKFITMSTKDCDSNWIPTNEFAGRFVMADSEFGITGGSTSHTHHLFEYSEINCDDSVFVATNESSTTQCNTNQDNILNMFTTPASNTPPYENVNFCTSRNGYLSSSSIILFDKNTPDGWDHISVLDNKFARGNDGTSPDTSGTHIHYASCINKDLSLTNGEEKYLTLNSPTETILNETQPPSYTFNLISNPSGGIIPSESILIVTELPPLGWEKYSQANGRLIKGSDNNFKEKGGTDAHFHILEGLDTSINKTSQSKLSNLTTKEVCINNSLDSKQIQTTGDRNPPPYISVLLAQKKKFIITGIETRVTDEVTQDTILKTKTSSQQDSSKTLSKLPVQEGSGEVLGVTAPTAPTDLLTEGQTNPTNITDHTPEFSAIYNDLDIDDTSSYYEIEVNTASDFTGTVMWDSGKSSMTTTNQGQRSPDISYAGSTLSTEITYYWRIKFWDSSDNESPWSSTANFKIAGIPTAATLHTCGLVNPTYIDSSVTFSAIYTDPNSDNSSNYEIEVNTQADFLGTIMWDTGKTLTTITSGSRSPEFEYSGTTLSHDSTTYYVRMRFWDTDDNVSNWATGQFIDIIKSFQINGLQINGIQLN